MIPSNLVTREEEGRSSTLAELMVALRQEREKKSEEVKVRTAKHAKYGIGKIMYEDDNIIKVEFEGYGEKEFSKMFCPLVME
jgi:hypothetical protein